VEVDTPLNAFDWTFDTEGRLRLVTTVRGARVAVHLAPAGGGADRWKVVAEFPRFAPEAIQPRHVDAEGRIYVEAVHADKAALFTLDPATGKLSAQPVLASQGFDLHPEFLTDGARLLG
jgi:hypothetical protein